MSYNATKNFLEKVVKVLLFVQPLCSLGYLRYVARTGMTASMNSLNSVRLHGFLHAAIISLDKVLVKLTYIQGKGATILRLTFRPFCLPILLFIRRMHLKFEFLEFLPHNIASILHGKLMHIFST